MKPSVFIPNIYSTMRTYYNQQPVLVLLLWSSSSSNVGLTHLFRNHWKSSTGHALLVRSLACGSFMVTTKSSPPLLLLTSKTNQTTTLSFQMQTDRAYLGEELIKEISRIIIQVHLNVMARYRLMPTTSKPEGFHVLWLSCPGMRLCEFDSTRSREITHVGAEESQHMESLKLRSCGHELKSSHHIQVDLDYPSGDFLDEFFTEVGMISLLLKLKVAVWLVSLVKSKGEGNDLTISNVEIEAVLAVGVCEYELQLPLMVHTGPAVLS
ncbi:hypothetical protein ACFX12_035448 [Malus domestica]